MHWEIDGKRVDDGRAQALAASIANLRIDAVLGTQPLPDWQQDRPQLHMTLKDAQDQAVTWALSKPKTGDSYVLKASDRPWYFELKEWAAKPLLDAAARDALMGGGAKPSP
jgi:hypothetical protein